MFYSYPVVVPANTPESAPAVTRIKLTAGVLHRVECVFPAGCQGMVHLAIEHQGTQHWPLTEGCSFSAEDFTVGVDDRYELDAETNELMAYAWSPGTTYPHTLMVRVGVLAKDVFEPQSALVLGLNRLLTLIGV
jgi:hypothetical protein